MELNAKRINEIIYACLFNDEENTASYIIGYGIRTNIGFHPERLEKHRTEISEMIDQLPDTFRQGDSFLNACIDKNSHQWGEHKDIEQLMQLGTAIGKISLPFERKFWPSLPGGMPYLLINN